MVRTKDFERSNVETTFSSIKRKLGETLKSKNRTAQISKYPHPKGWGFLLSIR